MGSTRIDAGRDRLGEGGGGNFPDVRDRRLMQIKNVLIPTTGAAG